MFVTAVQLNFELKWGKASDCFCTQLANMFRYLSSKYRATFQWLTQHSVHFSHNFHICSVQHLDIIKVLFIYQLIALVSCLKNNIKIYIKTAPTFFGVTVTLSSGSALICAYYIYIYIVFIVIPCNSN